MILTFSFLLRYPNAKTLSDAVSAVVPGFDNDPIAEKKTQEVNGVQLNAFIIRIANDIPSGYAPNRRMMTVSRPIHTP